MAVHMYIGLFALNLRRWFPTPRGAQETPILQWSFLDGKIQNNIFLILKFSTFFQKLVMHIHTRISVHT